MKNIQLLAEVSLNTLESGCNRYVTTCSWFLYVSTGEITGLHWFGFA